MKRTYKMIIAIILLVAVDLIMFLNTPALNGVFFVNFLFSTLAVILSMAVIIFLADREKKLFSLSLTAYAVAYLIAELGISFRFTFVPPILVRKVCIVHIVLLAVFLIVIICAKAENDFIKEQQEIRGRELSNFRYTLECMKNVQSKVEFAAPYRKTVEHAYDELASGQTASSPEVEDTERAILDAIGKLEDAVSAKDADSVNSMCGEIEKLAKERKARLACKANF